jgi:hypothetical protein
MALARALQELPGRAAADGSGNVPVHCLLLAPERVKEWARQARVPVASPPAMAQRDAEMLADWVAASLREFRPDALVVDVFPRGVLGELAGRLEALAPRRILLTRWVNPRYYLRPDVAEALRASYQGQLWSEPPAEALKPLLEECRGVERVPPVLFVRPQDVESSTAGRQAFGVGEMQRMVLGVGSGDAQTERRQLDALVHAGRHARHRFAIMFFAHFLEPTITRAVRVVRAFPAGAWLRACPVVVAAAGYQSYYEVVQANVPAVFRPLPRPIDDQLRRARGEMGLVSIAPHAVVEDDDALGEAVSPLLERELGRRYQMRGNLSDDVEMRGPAHGGAAVAAAALLRIIAEG